MKKVEILHDTIVRFKRGSIIEVDDTEASRLVALNNARLVEEKTTKKKKTEK